MKKINQIKSGAVLSYISIIFNIVAGLVYTPWMIGQIGQSDYGLYTLAISVISYFTLDFGFGGAISKFIAQFRAEKRDGEISNLLGLVYKFYFIIDLLILVAVVVIYCFVENIFVNLSADELIKFKNIFAIVGLFTLISFPCTTFNGILIAYEKFVILKVCDLLSKILTIVLIIAALLLGRGLYAIVIVNAGVQLLVNMIKFMSIKRTMTQKINFRYFSKDMLKMIFSFSIWMTIMGIAQRFIMNITPSVLGITAGAVAISVFSIGRTIEGYVFTFANALNSLFLPKVSNMVAANVSRDEITNLMIRVGRIQLIIVGAIITIFISMGQEFIVLWLGESFRESYWVTAFLIIPSIVTLTQDIGITLLVVENELKYRTYFYILAAVISVVLSFILSRIYGAIGAAIGIFTATIVGHIIGMNWVFKRKMNLNMGKFYQQCHLRAVPIFLIVFVSGILLQHIWITNSMVLYALKVCVIGAEYLSLMWFFYMNSEEKKLILNTIHRVFKK
ncbi:MAG: oligosaccharide flippase family protein [Clostridiales bacterium]|nr:oligosaccharide flippase family protein [Clostridiales bacterium]